jgi:ferric-dicitrate binding protein FerR (iron transport regulator)
MCGPRAQNGRSAVSELFELQVRAREGLLSPEDLERLKHAMRTAEGRTEFRDEALWDQALGRALRVEPMEVAQLLEKPSGRRSLRPKRIGGNRATGWLQEHRLAIVSLACAVSLLGVAFFFYFSPRKIAAQITEVHGEISVTRDGQTVSPERYSELYEGDLIQTGRGGAKIVYRNEATELSLKEETSLRVLPQRRGKRYELREGEVTARVAKQKAGRPMTWQTRQGEARIVGTTLSLAARRSSTWLEVVEGAVELSRSADHASVLVGQGQLGVISPGVELAARPLTREVNWTTPFPVKIPLFSAYTEDPNWFVSGQAIRQTEITNAERLFLMPPLVGSIQMEVTARVDGVIPVLEPGKGAWGFGCMIAFQRDTQTRRPESEAQVYVLESGQNDPGGVSFLRILDVRNGSAPKAVPYAHGREGIYHLKFRADPASADGRSPGRVRGKIWRDDLEPSEWMIQAEVPIALPLSYIALRTGQSACTFTRMKVGLVE